MKKKQLHASITWFRNEQEDLISRNATNPINVFFENKGGLDIEGIELESRFVFNENWYFTGSYSYQFNEDSQGIENFTLQPNSITKLGLGYTTKNWSIGIFDSYFDHFHDNVILNASRNKINPPAEAYHHLSINASLTLPGFYGVKLNLYMDNLLDEDVYLPAQPGSPYFAQNTLPAQSGRFFMLGITIPF
jgi:outer membrane receptor protein involved in Fe transport